MALIDKASLLFVPSVVAEGKAFNVLPSGNRAPDNKGGAGYDQTRADFDFDRGSNAAATRIGSDGLIKKYRENLFTNSNMFTGISLDGITRTTAQADPFGGSNAIKITENTSASNHRWYKLSATPTGVFTASVYAKYDSRKIIRIHIDNGNVLAGFDILNGTVYSTSSSVIDAKIEAVGTDGWYRCSVTANGTAAGWIGIYMLSDSGANSYTGDGSSSAFLFGFQLESGLVSTDYLDSTSVTGKAGVLVDLPRINYDANGENGSLLLEPSRQQLIQYSEYFGASSWALFGQSSLGSSFVQSPEGLSNAYTLNFNTSNESLIYYNYGSGSATFTTSVWARSSTGKKFSFRHWDGSAAVRSSDFTTTTEWKRFDFTFTSPIVNFGICNESAGGLGNVEIYGFQAELGSYPSSYIPNHGESGGVTRAADSCSVTGVSDVIGQTEGTIFIDANLTSVSDTNLRGLFEISDGTSSNRISVYRNTGGTQATLYSAFSGTATLGMQFNTAAKTKIAFNYSSLGVTLYVNGSLVGTDSVVSIPSCSRIDMGVITQLASRSLGDSISQVSLFKTALTDSELATLTTL
jgi:hypothetical protein